MTKLAIKSNAGQDVMGGSEEKHASLSKVIWNIPWEERFPFSIPGTDVVVTLSTYEEVADFLRQNFAKIYGESALKSPFLLLDQSEERQRYYRSVGDFFTFVQNGKIIGTFVGTAFDWSTYYLRNISMLPEYRGKKYYQAFLEYFLGCLAQSGVERAEGDIAPDNYASMHVLQKMEFVTTGLHMSERWGAMVHYTKFLKPRNRDVFLNQFCWGEKPEQKPARVQRLNSGRNHNEREG